jgi:methionine-rich copper-binding protein CopC
MKKLILAMAILIGLNSTSQAQAVKATTKTAVVKEMPANMKVVKPAKVEAKANATVAQPVKAVKAVEAAKPVVAVKPAAGVVLKKDGTPDKRYKASVKLKKDGTPDMRYKQNQK